MTFIVVVIPLFIGAVIGVNQKTGDVEDDRKPFTNFFLTACFTVLKYLIVIGSYIVTVASVTVLAFMNPSRNVAR